MSFSDKYSLILFDLDGTLTDTHQLIFDSFNFVLRKYKSVELTPKEIIAYFGPPEEVCLKNMLGEEYFDRAWPDFIDYYRSHIHESIVFEGLRELLHGLKASGKLVGVFTAKGRMTTEITLEYHGLKTLFDIIVTGSLVKNHKPDPEGINLALGRLNLPPGKTLVVGDSPSDYKAATSAGTDFIAVMYDNISKNRFGDVVCKKAWSVAELSAFLLGGGSDLERG